MKYLIPMLCVVVLISVVLAVGPGNGNTARTAIFDKYASTVAEPEKRLAKIVGTKEYPDDRDLIAIEKATDRTFYELNDMKLMDSRLSAYDVQWKYVKSLKKDPIGYAAHVVPFTQAFVTVGKEGPKGTTCTVTVGASKGSGALVKYAKAADAAAGGAFKQFGTTLATFELERAEYIFKTFRGGKETGKTDRVRCTDTKKPVTVTVDEP